MTEWEKPSEDWIAGTGPITPSDAVDPEILPLVKRYVSNLPKRVDEFRDALAGPDRERISVLAHQTKGVGTTYGYPMLTVLAARIEQAARENASLDEITELVDAFEFLTIRIASGISL